MMAHIHRPWWDRGTNARYQIWFLAAEQPPQETFHVDDDFSAEVAEVISNPAHFEILG
jgi:hypothetical protein